MFRGAPIASPEIDDSPGIGYLRRDEARTVQELLGAAPLAEIEDEEVLQSVRQIQDWLKTSIDSRRDLICFYA